jgi:hypothetical protein
MPELLTMLAQYPNIIDSIKRRPSTSKDLPPLVLRQDYFRYGITVGAWISGDNTQGHQGSPEMGLQGETDAFKHNDNGYFAFASARAGYRDPMSGEMVFSFEDGAMSIAAENWINSKENLYLADWEVSLVPMKTQVHTDDLDIEDSNENDSGLTYLLRRLSNTVWRETFFSQNQFPNINIENFNINSLEVYDLLQH